MVERDLALTQHAGRLWAVTKEEIADYCRSVTT